MKVKKYIHQKDLNGCGIATLSNLLGLDYDLVKEDFEKRFYSITKGIKIFDMVDYLALKGLNYESKFFNQNKNISENRLEGKKYSQIPESITLICKSQKYPVGHYLLRVQDGWVDPWIGYPSIDNVSGGLREKLPGEAWYVLYPKNTV